MRICFLVNDIKTEFPTFATTIIAYSVHKRGHTVYYTDVAALSIQKDGKWGARAVKVADKKYQSRETFIKSLQDEKLPKSLITYEDIDILWLRYNPPEEINDRPWAQMAGIVFGQMAVENGVLVINNPDTLAFAINKMYLQYFPREIRPETIVTRDMEEIKAFHREFKKGIILKPLEGYGGKDVFLVNKDTSNFAQIAEALSRRGYIMAQEYLAEARKGDVRIIMMNGKPLQHNGKYAVVKRVNQNGDIRNNMSSGGKPVKAKVTDEMLHLASVIGPKLQKDGIFYAGIDLVENKALEINVISTGNLYSISGLAKTDFSQAIVDALERKCKYRELYGNRLSNVELTTMD